VASVPKTITSYKIYGFTPSTEHTFTAKAKDNAKNLSAGVSSTFTTAATTPIIATGYVTDGLQLLLENPVNNSAIWNPNTYFNGTNQFTIAVTAQIPKNSTILSQFVVGGGLNRLVFNRNSNNQFNFQLLNASQSAGQTSSTSAYSDETAYYHIAVVRDSQNLKMYVNDTLQASLLFSSSVIASALPMIIGSPTLSPVFKNLAYYNKSLTTSELTQNYNALK
jgi:hypothetical protein